MTQGDKNPLYFILRSKRDVSRLQILAEITEHQPAVRQQEIADKLGVTPQAISEYIRELVEEGMVSANRRGNYEVTRSGIEWVLANAEALESYARHIRRDIIQKVSIWTAIAAEDLKAGDEVGMYMHDGFLYAEKKLMSATGSVVADAKKDEDVGIAHLTGIIEHHEGIVHVCKVPRIQYGGSRKVRREGLLEVIEKACIVAAVGLEAYIALKAAGRNPDMFFGAREGVIEAAFHGIDCAIIIVDEEFTDFLKRLETLKLAYVIHDIIEP
ncbi:MAG: winged helix-turn-helix transcriptional regulator [Methanoregula sp.]|nr:winged helix-turn-helix transcriptional regulator [Methanoregula sp.]